MMDTACNRRSFLAGATMAGAAAIAASALPVMANAEEAADAAPDAAPAAASASDVSYIGWAADYHPTVKWSWETKPDPIPDDQIIDTTETEILIIGAGIGGCAAACHAVELGNSVIVLEKTDDVASRGGHYASTDSRLMRENGIYIDKEDFVRRWVARCSGRCKDEIVWLYVNRSGEAMDWLLDKAEAEGFEAVMYDGQSRNKYLPEFPGTHMFAGDFKDDQGATTIPVYLFYKGALAGGAQFVFESPAQQLVTDDSGAVIGAVALAEDGYHKYLASKGVVLASGCIGGDPEMMDCYAPIGLKCQANMYTPEGANTGDGHKMGMWVGGQMETASIPTSLHLTAYTWQAYGFLHVNCQGKRFMNENDWVQAKSLKILQQPGHADYAWSIFDSTWPTQLAQSLPYGGGQFWDGMGRVVGQEWTPADDQDMLDSNIEAGLAFQADTLEELADLIGVDKETFLATVERYNELAHGGKDLDFGKEWQLMNTIEQGPFYATKFGPGLMTVNGGLIVDEKLRVLDKEQDPIKGLYAIGNCAGGRYGNDYPTILNGNTHGTAFTMGYCVPEFINEDA